MKDSIAREIGEILVDIKKSLEKLVEEIHDLSIEQSRIGDALLDIRDVLARHGLAGTPSAMNSREPLHCGGDCEQRTEGDKVPPCSVLPAKGRF
jgi:hypothetical protein